MTALEIGLLFTLLLVYGLGGFATLCALFPTPEDAEESEPAVGFVVYAMWPILVAWIAWNAVHRGRMR